MTRRIAIEDLRPPDPQTAERRVNETGPIPIRGDDSPDSTPDARGSGDTTEALIGRIVAGRYRVTKLLGRGGMGVVFEGEHLELEKRVAIKVLVAGYARDLEALARFEREARTAAKLGHPNIVATLDLGRLDTGEPFLVMEHLDGHDLVELVRAAGRGELTRDRMLRVLDQIGAALDVIHEAGVVHRDIKAENVLLVAGPGGREVVKVVDFGLATLADAERRGARLTREGMVIGTPEYIAPECVRGALGGPAADRYALAVLAFELASGMAPFEGPVPMEILVSKLTTDAPSLSSVTRRPSPALDAVLARGLARDPAERHGSCKELVDAIRTAIDADAKVAAAPSGRAQAAVARTASSRWPSRLAVVGAAALLGLGAAVASLGWYVNSSGPPAPALAARVEGPAAPSSPSPEPALAAVAIPTAPPVPTPTSVPTIEGSPDTSARARPAPAGASQRRAAAIALGAREPGRAAGAPLRAPAQADPVAPRAAEPRPASPEPPRPLPVAVPIEPGPSAADLVRTAQASLLHGHVAEARDGFREATRVAPRHAPAWRGLGIASEQLHEAPEARRAFERYLELAPDAPDAATVRARLARLGG